MGEDVNPSAYIVNLADCMLVLACGFMVAMIVYWNIDVSKVTELSDTEFKEVNPETLPESLASGGAYYIEAGKVYMDPNTGQLYMVQPSETPSIGGDNNTNAGASSGSENTPSGASIPSIIDSRASGAD